KYPMALKSLVEALITLQRIGARPDAEAVTNLLVQFRQALGAEKFDVLWKEEIKQPLPDWLSQSPVRGSLAGRGEQQEQGMSAEQFIAAAIQSAREKRPEAGQFFEAAQKMAADANAPKEVQALGRVLQRVRKAIERLALGKRRDEER
ncbi:MAG: hypothetical protein ACUVRJ_05675, partial [Candidatus Villigracilaceae bacterium]